MPIAMRPGQAYASAQSNQGFSVRQYFLQYQTVEFEANGMTYFDCMCAANLCLRCSRMQ